MNQEQLIRAMSDAELKEFEWNCSGAIREVFAAACAREEVQYAVALSPEFRPGRTAMESTTLSAFDAVDQYLDLLGNLKPSPIFTGFRQVFP